MTKEERGELITTEVHCYTDNMQACTKEWIAKHNELDMEVIANVLLNAAINNMSELYIKLIVQSEPKSTKGQIVERIMEHVMEVVTHRVEKRPSTMVFKDGSEPTSGGFHG